MNQGRLPISETSSASSRALLLAIAVHAGLVALLWFGIRWQNQSPVTVEAEIWNIQTRQAAPRRELPMPPLSNSVPSSDNAVPPKTASAPHQEPIARPPVEIALEQKKQRRLLEKTQRELAAQERQQQQKNEHQLAEKKLAEKPALKKKLEAEDDQKKQRDLKLAERQHKADAVDAQRITQQREQELRRLNAGLGRPESSGHNVRSEGNTADANYVQKVAAKIKSNTVFNVANEFVGNPAVEYSVELLPDGSLRGLRRLKSSGLVGFDDAVKRAIEKSQPYPPDKSGVVPSGFVLIHQLKDQ